MTIRTRLTRTTLLAGAATAVLIGVSAGAALAVNATWTVKPGGTVTGTAGTTTLKDTTTGNTLKCTSSKATATLKKGSGLSGTAIGSITKLSFSGCTGPLGIAATVTINNLPYKLNATSFNATSGTTTGSITGIDAKVVGGPCSVIVDGSGSTPNHTGKVKVTYTNSTHKLKALASGGNLHLFNATGCSPFFASGDAATFVGTYTVSPAQTITSP
jgi:hypothetical protein